MDNELEELGMIELKPVNKLIETSEIIELSTLPRPSTNLRGKQNCMSDLYTSHRKFANTPEDKFQYQWTLIQ